VKSNRDSLDSSQQYPGTGEGIYCEVLVSDNSSVVTLPCEATRPVKIVDATQSTSLLTKHGLAASGICPSLKQKWVTVHR
jgi:hypothetical protein